MGKIIFDASIGEYRIRTQADIKYAKAVVAEASK